MGRYCGRSSNKSARSWFQYYFGTKPVVGRDCHGTIVGHDLQFELEKFELLRLKKDGVEKFNFSW